jgi:hypothetical protein
MTEGVDSLVSAVCLGRVASRMRQDLGNSGPLHPSLPGFSVPGFPRGFSVRLEVQEIHRIEG